MGVSLAVQVFCRNLTPAEWFFFSRSYNSVSLGRKLVGQRVLYCELFAGRLSGDDRPQGL